MPFTRESRLKYYAKTQDSSRKRRNWTDKEDLAIRNLDKTDHQLSEELDRSVQAIQCRRHKLRSRYNIPSKISPKKDQPKPARLFVIGNFSLVNESY